jgi:hypothetical protein
MHPFHWPSFLPGIEKEASKKVCIHFIDPGLGLPVHPAPEIDDTRSRLIVYQIHFKGVLKKSKAKIIRQNTRCFLVGLSILLVFLNTGIS